MPCFVHQIPCRFANGVTGLEINDGMELLSPPATFCTLSPLPLLLLCLPGSLTLWRRSSRASFQQLGWILHSSTCCASSLTSAIILVDFDDHFNCLVDYQHHFSGVKLSFFSDYLLDFLLLYPPSLHIFANTYPCRLPRDAVRFDSTSKECGTCLLLS